MIIDTERGQEHLVDRRFRSIACKDSTLPVLGQPPPRRHQRSLSLSREGLLGMPGVRVYLVAV